MQAYLRALGGLKIGFVGYLWLHTDVEHCPAFWLLSGGIADHRYGTGYVGGLALALVCLRDIWGICTSYFSGYGCFMS
jgi:hypothetical protein